LLIIQSTYKLSGDFDNGKLQHHVGIANTEISRSYFSNGSLSFLPEGEINKLEYNGLYKDKNFKIIYGADAEKQTSKNNFSPDPVRYSNVGQFIEYKDNHINNLSLSLGVRADRSSNYGDHISSRVSLAYVIAAGSHEYKLRASSGNGFRAPSLNETTNSGAQVLEELIQVTHFDQSVSDEINFNNTSFTYEQVEGVSTSQGVEVSTTVPVDYNWSVVANYTYREKLKTSLNIRGAGTAIDVGNVKIENYVVANIGVDYQLDKKISFFGTVNNLLDKDYEESTGYNTADRSFNIGTQVSF